MPRVTQRKQSDAPQVQKHCGKARLFRARVTAQRGEGEADAAAQRTPEAQFPEDSRILQWIPWGLLKDGSTGGERGHPAVTQTAD
jgi:hypothetical protein